MFNMSFSDEQKDLQKMVREFAQKSVFPQAKEIDRKGEFAEDLF